MQFFCEYLFVYLPLYYTSFRCFKQLSSTILQLIIMPLNRVSDIVEASRMQEFPAKNVNGNTVRVVHSLGPNANPGLEEFDMVCYSLHGGSPHHLPREVRKRLGVTNDHRSAYRDYLNIERDIGANEMAEAFVLAMRQKANNVLCMIVRPPRGIADCNRPSGRAINLELLSSFNELLLEMHRMITDLLFDVQDTTKKRRVATVDFHTMAPKSTVGIDRDRLIRARRQGRQTRRLAKKDLPRHAHVWCESSQNGKPRPIAVIHQDANGNELGNYEFAMAVKRVYEESGITVACDDPYVTNPDFPGAQLMAGDGFHFEVPKNLVTNDSNGPFDLINCKGNIYKARALVKPLVEVASRIIDERTSS
jgi:hypothetical protein